MTRYMKLKPRKLSLIEVTRIYSNENNCIQFFFNILFPNGFVCPICGSVHYCVIRRPNRKPFIQCNHCKEQISLLAGTIFKDCKLPLSKLILALYLFFTPNKGISAIDLANQLDVNYKTACNLARKCRILMGQSNGDQALKSKFLEADVAYIGAESSGKQGMGTEQQPVLFVLGTDRKGQYPNYVKISLIKKDNKENIDRVFGHKIKIEGDCTLTTDGKTTFSDLSKLLDWQPEKINYDEENHSLFWLNKIISTTKANLFGIYRNVSKRDLPLFINEQEWRYNHRYIGQNVLNKISKYLAKSFPCPVKEIKRILDLSESYFA